MISSRTSSDLFFIVLMLFSAILTATDYCIVRIVNGDVDLLYKQVVAALRVSLDRYRPDFFNEQQVTVDSASLALPALRDAAELLPF